LYKIDEEMKNLLALFALILSSAAFSQHTSNEIRKEVRVENENGVKTVEIHTTENGLTTVERFTGIDADKKLQELSDSGMELEKSIQKRVQLEEIDGKKRLTVTTEVNGEITEEVFEGPDVDLKLKELELEGIGVPEMEVKKVVRKEVKAN
jgi:hypothetical protein